MIVDRPLDPAQLLLVEHLGLPVTWPFPWGWPSLGDLPPCPPLEVWRNTMLVAALERDRIADYVARLRAEGGHSGLTLIGAYRWRSRRDATAAIPTLAEAVARGLVRRDEQRALLAYACPEHMDHLLETLETEVAAWRHDREQAERRVRWKIRPLVEQQAPGEQILATAEAVCEPLRKREVLALCRQVAASSQVRRRRHA